MTDSTEVEPQLLQLREQLSSFRNRPGLSDDFVSWLSQCTAVIVALFGVESEEIKSFRAISPELSPEFYDITANKIGTLPLDEKSKEQLIAKLYSEAPLAVFKRKLDEYDETIAVLLHKLRSRG